MLPALLEAVATKLVAEPDVRRWVVALSGGLDSSLLLELCARLNPSQPLHAIYIDHQIQAPSADWGEHCRRHCERLNVSFDILRVNPESSSEASARAARYQAFESVLMPGDCLLLAQHADDQTETLLLRLLRGAGVAGLAAMPQRRSLGKACLLRPLLERSREELEQAAAELGLSHIEDPTNQQDHYDRNWLRLNIVPKLKQRWPDLLRRARETSALMSDTEQLLRECAEDDLRPVEQVQGRLNISTLRQLSETRQRNLLHHWITQRTGLRLSRQRLLSLQHAMLVEREDAEPQEHLANFQLRRYRDQLFLLPYPLPAADQGTDVFITVGQSIDLPSGQLRWVCAEKGFPAGLVLRLGFRQGGERLRPAGRGGSVSLKQLLQEAGLPPWMRSIQPILWADGEILALPGICLCEFPLVENGLLPQWDAFGLS